MFVLSMLRGALGRMHGAHGLVSPTCPFTLCVFQLLLPFPSPPFPSLSLPLHSPPLPPLLVWPEGGAFYPNNGYGELELPATLLLAR